MGCFNGYDHGVDFCNGLSIGVTLLAMAITMCAMAIIVNREIWWEISIAFGLLGICFVGFGIYEFLVL